MANVHSLIDLLLHLDKHLTDLANAHQQGVYAVLFAIVFCETGLIVWPFLPGDSLLFAVGALAAAPGSHINLPLVMVLLCVAANSGDLLNYSVGKALGPKVFSRQKSWLLNPRHLAEAQAFYERHGRGTIILARFVPIIRTFAPFVAGIGRMAFSRFVLFSIGGGALWVVSVGVAGYCFGQIDAVKKHFELVVLAIVAVSLIPAAVGFLRSRSRKDRQEPAGLNVLSKSASPLAAAVEER